MRKAKEQFKTASEDEILSAEILEIAREYQTEDFPNFRRKNCPSNEFLLKTANSNALPEAEFRRHLLSCSPCFREFQTARQTKLATKAAEKTEKTNAKSARFDFFLQPFPAFAFSLLLLIFGGWLIYGWLNNGKRETQNRRAVFSGEKQNSLVAQNTLENPKVIKETRKTFENKPANVDKKIVAPKKTTKPIVGKAKNESSSLVARNTIKIDLSDSETFRNQTKTSAKVVSLPAQSARLKLNLPKNSPAGDYTVSLLDEFGKALVKQKQSRSDGKTLTVNFDLPARRGLRARLCAAPQGEIPDCVPVKIGNDK